ncbi:MAG: 1-acyl-sn-glycerol-3-phosphate acyltransferase [Acidimicrobiia bacterium]|nr:1-acyl-sn-glycerol-3-phosphate acyltransferase [Acidimicrobiia bacterium]
MTGRAAAVPEAGRLQSPARKVVGPLLRGLWSAKVDGLEHVPTSGPALIAPNHISFIDSIFVLALMPRRTLAVGKAEYMDSWKTRYLFPAIGMIPLDRSGGSSSDAALAQAAASLQQGDLFLIYPEGTRSRDGFLHRGRTGVARLALRTGAPIVPVGIRGTDAIQPPGAVVPRPFKPCSLAFGPPIRTEKHDGQEVTRALLRDLTDEVMYEIGQLSGQTYRDTYGNEQPELQKQE